MKLTVSELNKIDWDTQITKKIENINSGAAKSITSAISWVFQKEENLIILEDYEDEGGGDGGFFFRVCWCWCVLAVLDEDAARPPPRAPPPSAPAKHAAAKHAAPKHAPKRPSSLTASSQSR